MYDPNRYIGLEDTEHIELRPGMYIGATTKSDRKVKILDFDQFKSGAVRFKDHQTDFPEGQERLFLETLWNAADVIVGGKNEKVDGTIFMTVDPTKKTITIKNTGIPIPVLPWPKNPNVLIPTAMFQYPKTSSNYVKTENREGGGLNGFGIKLTNFFSKHFSARVKDNISKKEFFQEWSSLKPLADPIVTEYTGDEGSVEVSFTMDFSKFEGTDDVYPDDIIALYVRHLVDVSFSAQIIVYYNNTKIDMRKMEDYAVCVFGDTATNYVINTYTKSAKDKKRKDNPTLSSDLCVLDTPYKGQIHSIANSVYTSKGGWHVNAVMKALVLALETDIPMCNKKSFMRHLSIIVSCRVIDPDYEGQTKSKLNGPRAIHLNLPDKFFAPLLKWKFVESMKLDLKNEQNAIHLSETDGKQTTRLGDIPGHRKANYAGHPSKSIDCEIAFVEGNSAAIFGDEWIGNERDHRGRYAMRGKIINALKAGDEVYFGNEIVKRIKKILGVREHVDYTNINNRSELNYGKAIRIMVDPDTDGSHIFGLLLALFGKHYNSLIDCGYISEVMTPVNVISLNKTKFQFLYTQDEIDTWFSSNKLKSGQNSRFIKGLCSYSPAQRKACISTLTFAKIIKDPKTEESLQLAFNLGNENNRKLWLAAPKVKPRNLIQGKDNQERTITEYINERVKEYSFATLRRAIPDIDGLKESARKLLWCSIKHWYPRGYNESDTSVKTNALAGLVTLNGYYHHGEPSMHGIIQTMALDIPGYCNLSYFKALGHFGEKTDGGTTAGQPRYTEVSPQHWWRTVFRSDDDSMLEPVEEEGKFYEPKRYLPVVPLIVINGAFGMATGFSTRIAPHHPAQVLAWLKARLRNQAVPDLCPWFGPDFKGTVTIIGNYNSRDFSPSDWVNVKETRIANNATPVAAPVVAVEEPDEPQVTETMSFYSPETGPEVEVKPKKAQLVVQTTGAFTIKGRTVTITELPIGKTVEAYEAWLENLLKDGIIKKVDHQSSVEQVNITITGFPKPTMESLRLVNKFSLTNMYFLGPDGYPIHMRSIQELMEYFYQFRLPYYAKRQENMAVAAREKVAHYEAKIKFIKDLLEKKIKYKSRAREDIYSDMDKLGHARKLLGEISLKGLSHEDIDDLKAEIAKLKDKSEQVSHLTPEELWLLDLNDVEMELESINKE